MLQYALGHAAYPLSLHGCIFLANYLTVSFIARLLNIPHFWCFRRVHRPCTTSASWIIAGAGLEGDEIFLSSSLAGKPEKTSLHMLPLPLWALSPTHFSPPAPRTYLLIYYAPSSPLFLLSNHWFFWASIKYLQYVGRLLSLGIFFFFFGWGVGGSFWKREEEEKKQREWKEERKREIKESTQESWCEYQCFTLKLRLIINK